MLQCSCGWRGVNLLPNKINNTADCPACHSPFNNLKANDAIIVLGEEERKISDEAKKGQLLTKVLSK